MMNRIKFLDFFGVYFELRMENYNSFTSKTGAIVFIFYIIVSIAVAFYYFSNYLNSFSDDNFIKKDYEEIVSDDSINFINQNFTFAVKLPNITINKTILENFFDIKVFYKYSDSLSKDIREYTKIDQVNKKDCNFSDLNTDKLLNFTEENIICFNFSPDHFIKGFYYSKIFSFVQMNIAMNENYNDEHLAKAFETNQVWINIFYPKNQFIENKVRKIMSNIYLKFDDERKSSTNIYLRKFKYLIDENYFKEEVIKYEVTSYETHETFLYKFVNTKKDNFEIAKIYLRQSYTQHVFVRIKQKIIILFTKINNFSINTFIILKIFMSIVNLKKAKKKILEQIFQINTHIDEKRFNKNVSMDEKNQNFQLDEKGFDSKFEKKPTYNERIEKKLENFQEKLYEISLDSHNIQNINNNKEVNKKRFLYSIDSIKLGQKTFEIGSKIKRKMIEANLIKDEKHYGDNFSKNINNVSSKNHEFNQIDSSILEILKKNRNEENKLNRKINLRNLIKMCFCCRFEEMKKIRKIYLTAEKKFDQFVDIINYIKKMQEIDTLKAILFSESEENIFNFVARPVFSIAETFVKNKIKNPKNTNNAPQNLDEEILFEDFKKIYEKVNKTDIEIRLIEYFKKKL